MSTKPNARRRSAAKKATRRTKPHAPPPAYFLSLTIENIRCFGPEQTLDLSDGHGRPVRWTVLLGENGTGKTTLLECLAQLEPGPANPYGDKTPLVEPRFIDDTRLSPLCQGYARHGASQATLSCSVAYGENLCPRAGGPRQQQMRVEIALDGSTLQLVAPGSGEHGDFEGMFCCAYGAGRRMRAGLSLDLEEADRCGTLFSEGPALPDAEEWLLQADYGLRYSQMEKRATRELLSARRERIVEALIQLLPDVHQVRIQDLSDTGGTVTLRVQFLSSGTWVTIDELGLGYRSMVAWVVDLARRLFERYPSSENPLAEPAVVLVDEIDLHMHPTWQRTLMQYLTERFPNTQFVVTAHSPLVVQAAGEDANVVLLKREGDHVVIHNDVEAVRGWRVDQVLTSDLFGLKTARPPQLEAAIEERRKLLGKSRLRKRDKERLAQLEAEIGDLPTAETPEGREAMDIIRRVAAKVKQREAQAGDQDT